MLYRLKGKSKITGIETFSEWSPNKFDIEDQKTRDECFAIGTIEYSIESKQANEFDYRELRSKFKNNIRLQKNKKISESNLITRSFK